MNLIDAVRRKLLLGNFLTQDELTQAQYELVTNPQTKPAVLLSLHDELFGGNLRNIPHYSLDEGPFFCFNSANDEVLTDEGDDTSETPEPQPLPTSTDVIPLTHVLA